MSKLQDITLAGEKFNDADGNEKTRWHNVGVLITNDEGRQSITFNILNAIVGHDVWFSVFDRKPRDGAVQKPKF